MRAISGNVGTNFEHFAARVFESNGYSCHVTKATGDGGIDIIMKKEGNYIAVECKKYKRSHHVSREVIQKLESAMRYNPYRKEFKYGYVVTTSAFTREAVEHARLINRKSGYERIKLIDGYGFKRLQKHRMSIKKKILFIIEMFLIAFCIYKMLGL